MCVDCPLHFAYDHPFLVRLNLMEYLQHTYPSAITVITMDVPLTEVRMAVGTDIAHFRICDDGTVRANRNHLLPRNFLEG
jgi:hypothetical protein